MKAFRSFTSIVGIVVCICGCATSGTDRVVQIGPNTYKMGGLGKSTDFSGSAVKARLYQQAAEFCRSKGGQMIPLNSTGLETRTVCICGDSVQVRACKQMIVRRRRA